VQCIAMPGAAGARTLRWQPHRTPRSRRHHPAGEQPPVLWWIPEPGPALPAVRATWLSRRSVAGREQIIHAGAAW